METEAIRAKHPDWSARKIDTLALESAKPYGNPDVIRHYAHSIPHGTFPGEIQWLDEEDVEETGLAWHVPSWDEIKKWFAEDGDRSEYVDQINAFGRGSDGEWHHRLYPPLTGEEDLVRLLAGVDPFWAYYVANRTFPLLPSKDGEPLAPAKNGQVLLFA